MTIKSLLQNKFFHSKYFYFDLIILTITAGALFLFWPILSGKALFSPNFIGHYYMYLSQIQYFMDVLNIFPGWWPAFNSGYPINLTLDGFLNPIFLVTLKFLPPFLANNLLIFVFFLINGLSIYALARALKLSQIASLITSISYAFSGVIIAYISVTTIAALMPFLPLSFLCCLKILKGKTKWFWLWLPLLVYSWIGGWAEMMVYALVAVTFFALYLIVKKRKSENFSYRYPILFFVAIIISVIILSPWFLSVWHFVSFSERSSGVNFAAAQSMPTTISHLIHMFQPRLSVFYGGTLPLVSFNDGDYFLFVGFLPLLLILASFFIKNKKEKGHLVFFMTLAGGAILMTINNSPLFWLFHQTPILKWFQGYWKWSFLIVFSLALLAGYGIDHIKDFFKHRFSKYVIGTLWALTLTVLLILSINTVFDTKIKSTIASYGISHYEEAPDRVFLRSNAYYQNIVEKMSFSLVNNFSFKNKWTLLSSILWFITLVHFTLLKKYKFIPYRTWKVTAVLVTLLGSTLVWTNFLTGPPVSYLKTNPATAEYLHSINPYTSISLPLNAEKAKTLEPYRIFLYLPDQYVAVLSEKYGVSLVGNEIRESFSREMMDDNRHKAFHFDTFRNHQTLARQRLVDTYYLARQQKPFTDADSTPFSKYINAFSEEKNFHLLGMLNIKYILTPLQLGNELKPIFTTYAAGNKFPVFIYENPYFMPRWYFANDIKWTEPEDKIIFEDLKLIEDFGKTTLLEKLSPNDEMLAIKPDKDDSFGLELYTAGVLRVKTKTKNHRFFVFSENRQPFWGVTINGKPTPLYTSNYLFQAVLVPPGENVIEFKYPNLLEQSIISAKAYIK